MKLLPNFFAALALTSLLAGCAAGSAVERQRFFWPPPPAQPRIEFVDFFLSEEDLNRDEDNWLLTAIIGKEIPEPLFKSPADVASDGRRVMVTDGGRHQVLVLDRLGKELRFLKAVSGEPFVFSAPYGVAIDPDGNAYVTDTISKKVLVFGPDEMLKKVIGDEQLSRPTGVAVDAARKRLYVADTADHHVAVFDLDGRQLFIWGERGPGEGTFNFPTDVGIDAAGNVYVLDSLNAKVQVFDPAGTYVRSFGERGTASGSFQLPKGLAVTPSGLVMVTDSMAKRFVIFSNQGDYLLSIGGKQRFADGNVNPGGFYLPIGIDVDQNSAIWVVDALNRIVHQYQHLTDSYLQQHPIDPKDVYQPRIKDE